MSDPWGPPPIGAGDSSYPQLDFFDEKKSQTIYEDCSMPCEVKKTPFSFSFNLSIFGFNLNMHYYG